MRKIAAILICFGFPLLLTAQTSTKMMVYNLLNFPGSTPERESYFKTVMRHEAPDLLMVCELQDATGADALLAQFNSIWPGKYSRAMYVDGPGTDNMLYYNHFKFGISKQAEVTTNIRWISHFKVYFKDVNLNATSDTVQMNLFMAHLKASSGSSNETEREGQAQDLMNYIATNTNEENIIFGGDFNIYEHVEPAFQIFINDASNPLFDPINEIGSWHNNNSYESIHTQSTRTTSFGGGVPGGMDDRFDMILINNDFNTGIHDVSYIPGTYNNPGNDGNHFDQSIVEGAANNSVPDSVLQALWQMSDHLPVVMKISANVILSGTSIPSMGRANFSSLLTATDGSIYLKINKQLSANNVMINIVAPNGQLINSAEYTNTHQTIALKTNSLPRGLYLVRIFNGDELLDRHKMIVR